MVQEKTSLKFNYHTVVRSSTSLAAANFEHSKLMKIAEASWCFVYVLRFWFESGAKSYNGQIKIDLVHIRMLYFFNYVSLYLLATSISHLALVSSSSAQRHQSASPRPHRHPWSATPRRQTAIKAANSSYPKTSSRSFSMLFEPLLVFDGILRWHCVELIRSCCGMARCTCVTNRY